MTTDADVANQLDSISTLKETIEQLHEALATRTQIATAVGILAATLRIGTDEAWDVLRRFSNHLNVKVRDAARVIVDRHNGELRPDDVALAHRMAAALDLVVLDDLSGLGDGPAVERSAR